MVFDIRSWVISKVGKMLTTGGVQALCDSTDFGMTWLPIPNPSFRENQHLADHWTSTISSSFNPRAPDNDTTWVFAKVDGLN